MTDLDGFRYCGISSADLLLQEGNSWPVVYYVGWAILLLAPLASRFFAQQSNTGRIIYTNPSIIAA